LIRLRNSAATRLACLLRNWFAIPHESAAIVSPGGDAQPHSQGE
jgi:hypothetical protein